MKLGLNLKLAALVLGALMTTPAAAVEVGLNFGGTLGEGELPDSPLEFDMEGKSLDLSMRFCERCRFLDYRLNVGYSALELDYFGQFTDDAKGITITNTAGFKAVNTGSFSFWLGASAYAGALEVDGDVSDRDSFRLYGFGPTLGVDFLMPEGVTISIELMARILTADIDNDTRDDYDVEDAGLRLSFLF